MGSNDQGKENGHVSATSRDPLSERARRRLRRTARRIRTRVRPESRSPRVVPDVVEERTNLGSVMDALVVRAKRAQRPLGIDPDYDLLRDNFDHVNFMLESQSSQELPPGDPIGFFLNRGAEAGCSPNYNFAMGAYLERYPHRREGRERSPYLEWLKRGRAAGEIADPAPGIETLAHVLGLEPDHVVDELVSTRTDMMERLRTGELGRMFAKAAEIEPLIGAVWCQTPRTRLIPLGGKFVVGMVGALHACQEQAGFKRARLVVVTDRPRSGAGRAFVGNLARGLVGPVPADEIVVVYTDESVPAGQGSLPAGIREVDFAAAAAGLPDEHRQQALVSLIRSFDADAVVNVDSRALYRLLAPYGKALTVSERIFLAFNVNELRADGHWDGWSLRWFYAGFSLVAGFITESEYLRDQLTDRYQLSEADRLRVHVFRAPVDPELVPVPLPDDGEPPRRPVVHWVGRRHRQKRMDIALEIARRMPDVDFRFWNDGVTPAAPARGLPPNVRVGELPARIGDLDLTQADAWLHTWAWGGAPSILLDVAMTEIPIVASLVGGAREVLTEDDAWLVADWQEPEAYEKMIREILVDRAAARLRSQALRERLLRERPHGVYGDSAVEVLLGTPASEEDVR